MGSWWAAHIRHLLLLLLFLLLLFLLDPDLEAETVAGVALRRLTGAGTVPFDTLRENKLVTEETLHTSSSDVNQGGFSKTQLSVSLYSRVL